jgi:hypothetical protein
VQARMTMRPRQKIRRYRMEKLCPNVSHVSGENETGGRVNIHFAVRGIVVVQGWIRNDPAYFRRRWNK